MTTLVLELSEEIYDLLHQEAEDAGDSMQAILQGLLVEKFDKRVRAPKGERERAIEILRAAGLLTELGPEMKARAERSTATLEEVQAILDRVGGKPLSEVIIEMRGPKV